MSGRSRSEDDYDLLMKVNPDMQQGGKVKQKMKSGAGARAAAAGPPLPARHLLPAAPLNAAHAYSRTNRSMKRWLLF